MDVVLQKKAFDIRTTICLNALENEVVSLENESPEETVKFLGRKTNVLLRPRDRKIGALGSFSLGRISRNERVRIWRYYVMSKLNRELPGPW
jgi:hypothetical protein